MCDSRPRQLVRVRFAANFYGARSPENLHSPPKSSDRAPKAACPLLAGALAVALRLFGSTFRIFFNKSFVSGREMSGERGPPSSPCFGPHGAGSTGFCTRSGMANNLRRTDKKASSRLSAGSACHWKPLAPHSEADELPGR